MSEAQPVPLMLTEEEENNLRKLEAWIQTPQHIAPTGAAERKALPITTGVLDYFPDALLEIARLSKAGNDQHNPGQPLHWAREKSTDHADCILRHMIDRGKLDVDGQRHSAKVAWRALAQLQVELEADKLTQGYFGELGASAGSSANSLVS